MKQETGFDLRDIDCVQGMAKLEESSVDLCVTSPPYNLGIEYNKYKDDQGRRSYLAWTRQWVAQVRRLLKVDGSFFLNIGSSPSNPMLPHEVLFEIKDLFVLQNTIHWIKSITVETRDGQTISAGHFKPISSHRFLNDCHEYVFHLTKTGKTPIDRLGIGVPYADKSNVKRWGHTNGRDKRCRGNTWFIPYQTIQNRKEQRPHPATFPKELAAMCIRLSKCKSVMLDPFLGIGNAALAARDCGVEKFIGFEIDALYLKTARERLSEAKVPAVTTDCDKVERVALNALKAS